MIRLRTKVLGGKACVVTDLSPGTKVLVKVVPEMIADLAANVTAQNAVADLLKESSSSSLQHPAVLDALKNFAHDIVKHRLEDDIANGDLDTQIPESHAVISSGGEVCVRVPADWLEDQDITLLIELDDN